MKINYFEDTDTALIEFTSERVARHERCLRTSTWI